MATRLAVIRGHLQRAESAQPVVDIMLGYLLDGLALAVEWLDALREGDLASLMAIARVGSIAKVPLSAEEYNAKIEAYIQKGIVIDRW